MLRGAGAVGAAAGLAGFGGGRSTVGTAAADAEAGEIAGGSLSAAGFLSVAETDAVGDGETDDAPALRRAVGGIPDGEQRVLLFEAGRCYRLGSTVDLPLKKIRGVAGNGASLVVDGDHPAVRIVGTRDGTASPGYGDNRAAARTEFGATVRDLAVHGPVYAHAGTGLVATKTFGLSVVDCQFSGLRTGLAFVGRNRNATVRGNRIWDNRDHGVAFVDGDLHQINVLGNHVSYSERCVYAANSSIANLQFVGNDVETSPSAAGPVEAVIHVDTSGEGSFVESVVANNTIQGHGTVENALRAGPGTCYEILISGNEFRNVAGSLLSFDACSYLSIRGNALVNGGTAIEVARYGGYLVVDGNVANRVDRFLDAYVYGDLLSSVVTGNLARCRDRYAFRLHSDADVPGLTLAHNSAEVTADADADATAGALFVVEAGGSLSRAVVTGNRGDLAGNAYGGLRVAAGDYEGVVVRDNVLGGAGGSRAALDLPAGGDSSLVVADNLAVE